MAERSFDQPIQIVQAGPVQEASGANLDGCQRGEEAVMPAGGSKVGVLVLLELAGIIKAGLMGDGQLNQVNIGAVPHDNIGSLIRQSHKRRKVVAGAREISDDAHAHRTVVRQEGEDGSKDTVMSLVVPPHLQGYRAVVQDMQEVLDLATQGA